VIGVHLPTPYTGFQGMKAGLIHDTYIEVFSLIREKKTHNVVLSPEVQREFEQEL